MSQPLLQQSLGSIACEIPGATRIFYANKLDFCCGGGLSLQDAAQKRGIDPAAIAAELESLSTQQSDAEDWRLASDAALIEHILGRYHARHREQLPELIRLASRVEQVHGQREDCPEGLTELLHYLQQELESHMLKEEHVLFPALLDGAGQRAAGPISVMRSEHEEHASAIRRLLELTEQITPPRDACNTWRALYRGLDEFVQDFMQHIHLENNLLFSNALNPESQQPAPAVSATQRSV